MYVTTLFIVDGGFVMSPISLKLPSRSANALCFKHRRCGFGSIQRRKIVPVQAQLRDGPGATPKAVKLQSVAVAMAAATWLAFGHPAIADIQTVPLNEATNMAKALQKKPVNKGRVWLLMVLGGAALFGTTVLLENNDRWFPAISKANKAMSASKAKRPKQQEASAIDVAYEEEQQRRLEAVQAEREADAMAQAAVLAGLQQAQQNVLGSESSPAGSTAEVDDSPSTSVEQINAASSSKQPSSVSGTSGAAAGADAAAQGQSDAAASGFAPDNTDPEAEADAKNYPPLVFEPGSLDRVRKGKDGTETAPQVLQGMSDEQLEAALRQRQNEMEKQQQQ